MASKSSENINRILLTLNSISETIENLIEWDGVLDADIVIDAVKL